MPTTPSGRRSFLSFWTYGVGKAFRKSWEKYKEVLIGLGLLYTLIAVFFHEPLERRSPRGFDPSLFFTLEIPAFCLLLFLIYHLSRAPYEIYGTMYDVNVKLSQTIETHTERERPKLVFLCGATEPECIVDSHGLLLRYFRAVVINNCVDQGITGCQGILTKIEHGGRVIRDHDIHVLPFAPGEDADSTSKVLRPGNRYALDLLGISYAQNPQIVFLPGKGGQRSIAHTRNGTPVFTTIGGYILTVRVVGDGIPPIEHRVMFSWTGDYKTSNVSLMA